MASGAIEGAKADVVTEYFLVECKRTDRNSISFKKRWIDKVDEEAINVGKAFALHLQLNDRDLVVIDAEEFKGLVESLDALVQLEREGYQIVKEVVDGV